MPSITGKPINKPRRSNYEDNIHLPYREVGSRLKEWRLSSGYTQEAIANKCGVSRRILSYIERGERLPSAEIMWHLANLAHLDIFWLITGTKTDRSYTDFEGVKEYITQTSDMEKFEIYTYLVKYFSQTFQGKLDELSEIAKNNLK